MFEKYKVLRGAEKLVAGGKYGQAIREYEKLVAQEGDEPNLINTLGDLLLKEGRRDEAVARFNRVAQIFDDDGHDAKALAIRRKIYNINPVDSENNEALIELYTGRGLTSDAVSLLQDLVRRHEEWGQLSEALNYQRRISQLDGAEPANLQHLARLYRQQGDANQAVDNYVQAARICRQQGMDSQFENCVEEIRRIDESDPRLVALLNGDLVPDQSSDIEAAGPTAVDEPVAEAEKPTGTLEPFQSREVESPEPEVGSFDLSGSEPQADPAVSEPTAFDLVEPASEIEESVEETGESEVKRWEGPVEDGLQEADFYLKLGHQEDAERILQALVATFPGDERVRRRAEKAGVAVPEMPDAEGADEGFEDDLDMALNTLFSGGDSEAPAEVLRYDVSTEGKRGVRDNAKVHYDLGLAYKEMGLVEDSIEKFKEAFSLFDDSDNAPQMILCCSMLANAYLHLEQFQEAEEWATRGLELPDLKEFERKALLYDQATALGELDRPSEAADVYRDILERDASYRDAKQRLDSLQQSDGR